MAEGAWLVSQREDTDNHEDHKKLSTDARSSRSAPTVKTKVTTLLIEPIAVPQ